MSFDIDAFRASLQAALDECHAILSNTAESLESSPQSFDRQFELVQQLAEIVVAALLHSLESIGLTNEMLTRAVEWTASHQTVSLAFGCDCNIQLEKIASTEQKPTIAKQSDDGSTTTTILSRKKAVPKWTIRFFFANFFISSIERKTRSTGVPFLLFQNEL